MPQTRGPRLLSWPTTVPRPLSCPPITDADSDGPKVIRWIEANCVYGEGDTFGEPVKLQLFQKIFLIWLFELRPDGRYRYRRAYLETPKSARQNELGRLDRGLPARSPAQRGDPGGRRLLRSGVSSLRRHAHLRHREAPPCTR
jgi:hypothetical protein